MCSRVKQVRDLGQSVWYDNLSRQLLLDGTLFDLISQGEITGVTTNPAILKQAFINSNIYNPAIESLRRLSTETGIVYQALIVEDIRLAADLLRGIYESSGGEDGYVSVEVSPHLALDIAGTIKEAKELFMAIDRPNVLIKIPGTSSGFAAIRELIADGINVNVTLLFSQDSYQKAALAYIEGLEKRAAQGKLLDKIASVASYFVSRWDTLVDGMLDKAANVHGNDAAIAMARGKTGITLAKRAYRLYQDITKSERWLKLQAQGAQPQRLLFASTGTKDPLYSDVYYVEELIAPGTITTLPPKTLAAFRDHGLARSVAELDKEIENVILNQLKNYNINLSTLADKLLEEGLKTFVQSYDDMLQGLQTKEDSYL